MKIYIDTEFHEGFKLGWNLRYYHTIELIQIGIKSEDGRTYTAINKNFNPHHANDWVRENVLQKIITKHVNSLSGEEQDDLIEWLDHKSIDQQFRIIQRLIGKSQKQIASEVFDFVNPDLGWHVSAYNNSDFGKPDHPVTKHFDKHNVSIVKDHYYAHPTFIGYFCDYDWVLFCSLFGTMMDLPPGFPMYMVDLKQKLDELVYKTNPKAINNISEFEKTLSGIKSDQHYPEQTNEHDALADAEWNEQLAIFLKNQSLITNH